MRLSIGRRCDSALAASYRLMTSVPVDTSNKGTSLQAFLRAVIPRPMRNWLRSPGKSAAWIWDWTKFRFGVRRTLDLAPNCTITCHPRAYQAALESQLDDPLQCQEFQNFLSHCSSDMFLFDIGAHFGVFSIATARLGNKAVAVDASPTATRMIAIQAALNECASRIEIVRAAVSDSNGVMGLLSAGPFSNGYFRISAGRSNRELTPTPSITVDDLVRQFGVPTHIKVDVEGHEAAVLRGARHTLSTYSPVLFLELHNEMIRSDGGDPNSVLDALAGLGYVVFDTSERPIRAVDILKEPIARVVGKRSRECVQEKIER